MRSSSSSMRLMLEELSRRTSVLLTSSATMPAAFLAIGVSIGTASLGRICFNCVMCVMYWLDSGKSSALLMIENAAPSCSALALGTKVTNFSPTGMVV